MSREPLDRDREDGDERARPEVAAVVGCGVIGAGWAARLALSGVTVRVADPAPGAEVLLREVVDNAIETWASLGLADGAPSPHDRLTVTASIDDAVDGAHFIQESVSERLELKRSVLAAIEAAAPADALIASSTSGIRPTELQRMMVGPERLVVGHPFNPVYLLPLVEVVGGAATAPSAIEQAMAVYRALGMRPLHW